MPSGKAQQAVQSKRQHQQITKRSPTSTAHHQQHPNQHDQNTHNGRSNEELASLQCTEIEVLASIFGPDFRIVDSNAQSPWKKSGVTQHQFEIILRPEMDELKTLVWASTTFRFPIRYPLLAPFINVEPPGNNASTAGISIEQAKELEAVLTSKAKEIAGGGEMVWELVSTGQEWISTHNLHLKKDEPQRSLEEEKLLREQEREHARQVQAQQESQQQSQFEAERASKIALLIEEQSSQQSAALKMEKGRHRKEESASINDRDEEADFVAIDAGAGHDRDGRWIETFLDPIDTGSAKIHSIIVGPLIRQTGLSTIHLVEAANNNAGADSAGIAKWHLECFIIDNQHYSLSSGKRKLQEVEWVLDKMRSFKADNNINILSSALVNRTMGQQQSGKKLLIVTEATQGLSARLLLSHCIKLPWERVRCYLMDMLSALDALHAQNLLHRDVSLDNIYLDESAVHGKQTPGAKLAHTGYWKRLLDMNAEHPLSRNRHLPLSEDLPGGWEAAEVATSTSHANAYTRKRDVWQAGVATVQMLFGVDVIFRYSSIDAFFNSQEPLFVDLGAHIIVYLKAMLEKSTRKRPSAAELKSRLEQVVRYEEEEGKDGSKTLLQGKIDQSEEKEVKGATGRLGLTRAVSQLEDLSLFRPGSFWQFTQGQGLPTSAVGANISRYESDFEELELLGKGAFGAVFRARNRLDGRDYAIKKIRLSSSAGNDEKTLREISALSRLSHQHIVRYVTCWIQVQELKDIATSSSGNEMTSSRSLQTSARDFLLPGIDDFLSVGHDALSKAGQNIRFAHSDDESDSSESEEDPAKDVEVKIDESSDSESTDSDSVSDPDWHSSKVGKSRKSKGKSQNQSNSAAPESTLSPRWLFIQMEYVENKTLREAIDNGVSVDDCWRLFRQMVEALAHVASLGIIHRDLKPSNVLMLGGGVNEDGEPTAGDIKIGDFGLATTTPQQQVTQEGGGVGYGTADETADLTTEIGTNLYIAPEMDKAGSRYDYKVDIYAIGIIFFEMLASQRVYKTGMERVGVLRDLRTSDVCFPKGWNEAQMTAQTKIIRALLSHDPASRPSPLDLLKSELLPPKMEDEYIAECLRLLSNPNSTYNLQLMDSLFSRKDDFEQSEARDFTFDSGSNTEEGQSLDNRFIGVACQHLRALFHRRGAVELEAPLMIPPNELYNEEQKPVELLDKTGRKVQLPYDLVVPFARMVARAENQRFKRYAIAPVYRNNLLAGGQPRSVIEVDYDIVAPEKTAAAEGEVLSVVDEILDNVVGFDSSEWVIQISHSHILDLLLERIPTKHRREALQAIGSLFSGSKTAVSDMRARLSNLGLGIPRSVIDEIEMANQSDEVEVVSEKLHRLIALDLLPKLSEAIEEILQVIEAARHFGVQRRFLLTPLLITNRSFYKDNVFFVVARLRGKRRDVLASGGRYDALLKRFTNPALTRPPAHAVGIQIGLGRVALALAKQQELASATDKLASNFTPSRCDVYVAASGPNLLSLRMEICRELWAANISADLAYEHAIESSVELLASTCKAEGILFLVIIRARHSSMVKVKSIFEKGEYEVNRWELSTWLGDRISRFRGSGSNVDVAAAAEKSGTNINLMSTLNPIEAEVLLPERYATDKRKVDRHGNNDRRIKKHLAPIQENSIRQVLKAVEEYSSTFGGGSSSNSNSNSASNSNVGKVASIIAVDFALFFTFQRLCAAAMAKTDEGLWKLFMECFQLPEERDYARAIKRRIEDLTGKTWLVSIRHEGSAFLVV